MTQIIVNGHIYLNRDQFAEALLIQDGLIQQVGTTAEITAAAPAGCECLDAQGRTIIPGFNDSHLHLHHLGASLNAIVLNNVDSLQKLIDMSRKFIEERKIEPGRTVTGRGWNQDYFADDNRIPNRHDLDKISTEHPVLLTRACGHVAVCNTLALEMAGLTAATPQPEGGQFDVDENGEPLGILREPSAINLLMMLTPPPSREEMARNLKAAMEYAATFGITSLQSNDVKNDNYRDMLGAYADLDAAGQIPVRAYQQACFYDLDVFEAFLADGYVTGKGTACNKIGPLKLFIDGSLGARTALMRNDYADEPGTQGIQTFTLDGLDEIIRTADDHGMQVAIHAIGDRAIEIVLDSYAKVIQNHENKLRHGIVHCQITDQAMVERFKENDILALVQPIFIHYDMHVVGQRVGKELESTSYAFGTMGKMGIHVSYGTDCPVEDLNTFNNLYCAVTRMDLRGNPEGAYFPGEKVDIYTAIDNYTAGSAYNSFEEDVKGRLLPGYYADLAILDRDIFAIPEMEIKDVSVLTTMMGGKVTFQR